MPTTFTELEYWGFIGKFIFSTLLLGYIVFMALSHFFNRENKFSATFILLLSLGLTPGLIALFLYYALLLFPHQSSLSYILIVMLPFALLFSLSIKQLKLYRTVIKEFRNWYRSNFKTIFTKILLFGTILFMFLSIAYFNYYLYSKEITEHDTLEYAVQGKVFFTDASIPYDEYRYDEKSGFYYVGLHGFSFPLQATWERHLNTFTGLEKDIYFRSINMFYGTLIALLMLVLLSRQSIFLGLTGALTLFICYGFFETFMKYHIDNMRIFFLVASMLFFVEALKQTSTRSVFLFGIFLGLQVNSHSLGALISFIQLAVLFLYIPGSIVNKLKLCSLAGLSMLAFGGIHYCIDVLTGTGWLFQQVKFY
jgi:hypothetical protein